jgi:hypothetical protein
VSVHANQTRGGQHIHANETNTPSPQEPGGSIEPGGNIRRAHEDGVDVGVLRKEGRDGIGHDLGGSIAAQQV